MMDAIPGPNSRALAEKLRLFESPGVAYLAPDFPIFWDSASNATVVDADGNAYLDFTAAFGVAAVGHCNPAVAGAIGEQAAHLAHAMGDVHPPTIRPQLLEALARIAPGNLSKTYLCSSGSEAVEAALKTALLYTGRPRVAAFRGAYHGLSLGALEVCGLPRFRTPFEAALTQRGTFFEYPRTAQKHDALPHCLAALCDACKRGDIGAVIVEPILARGGIVVPPDGFLTALRELCDRHGILLILDEIYTGFGRTGTLFAAQRENVVPDIMCLGKAIANGFPLSAAIATPGVMDAWQPSAGEALHTSTYLGNPMGCAAALATIAQIEQRRLPERAQQLGEKLQAKLELLRRSDDVVDVRGRGMMWGIELRNAAAAQTLVTRALRNGLILLQTGESGNTISITPPLTIAFEELERGLAILESLLQARVMA